MFTSKKMLFLSALFAGIAIPSTAAVAITDDIFRLSDENNKYYYSIQDNRGDDMAGPFYWTLGSHNGYKAIQVTNENKTTGEEKGTQLFYFMPGTNENMFKIYTYDGQMVDYLDGLTLDSWNGGNTTTTTETHKYLQYGTSTSGEFQLVTSESEGYYGIAYSDGTLMNDRGTANGSAVNMKWVINTYNNNSTTDSGSRYKFTLVEPRRTVTVESSNAEQGSVAIEGETGTSVELPATQTIVIKATATDGYMFYRWIEKDTENVVSYRHTYTYTIAEDKTLVAEFVEKDYPIMTRFYEVGLDQQNRYLGEASYMVGDETHELFVCENETDLPFTAYTQLHTTQMEGAVIDKTSTPIQLNEGVESFTLKVKQYSNNITYNGNTCEPELVWTRQTLFIDWNNDKEFAGTDEVYATMGNGDSDNNFGDTNGSVENGWQRTINVPAGTEAGTYRMRVVYMAPNPYTEDWPSKVFTDFFGELRNGIAYDFEIQIAQASAIDAVTESAIYYDAQAQLLVAPSTSEVTVYNLAGQLVLDAQGTEISVASLAQGVYIAKVGNQVIKFVK